ncbi:hypothetical protein B0T25DRAFT_98578 [Lasiosphaeria hispida]|uniref:Uncharacterized protein n=1 Tax=Lasiosphaeria hispida TaxID=260671 RepID=A0AAJ0HQN5_9PEZI|nr:hypothetical protein B0T25DRAFT_98578 [Lasiosphaeria hispida]
MASFALQCRFLTSSASTSPPRDGPARLFVVMAFHADIDSLPSIFRSWGSLPPSLCVQYASSAAAGGQILLERSCDQLPTKLAIQTPRPDKSRRQDGQGLVMYRWTGAWGLEDSGENIAHHTSHHPACCRCTIFEGFQTLDQSTSSLVQYPSGIGVFVPRLGENT